MASSSKGNNDVSLVINHSRLSFSFLPLLSLLMYFPFGLLLLLFRLFLIPQAVILLFIIPQGFIKRLLLRILVSVLGLAVVKQDFDKRSPSTRMFIGNWISFIDYISIHMSMECSTSSTNGDRSLISRFFRHHAFSSSNSNSVSDELKKIPEFNDDVSLSDSDTVPLVCQPEPQPTNGKGLLSFDLWSFKVVDTVQPLAISSWRPLNVNLTTIDGSEISDFLWTLFCPITIVYIQMLPVIERRDDSVERFAKKTQKQIAAALRIPPSDFTQDSIKKWRNSMEQSNQSNSRVVRSTALGPIILEADYNKVRTNSEVEKMVQQVLAVFPDAPQHLVRKDLLQTRSIDATSTNYLEGRLTPSQTTNTPQQQQLPSKTTSFSLQDCHEMYLIKKQKLIEDARRRYTAKH